MLWRPGERREDSLWIYKGVKSRKVNKKYHLINDVIFICETFLLIRILNNYL